MDLNQRGGVSDPERIDFVQASETEESEGPIASELVYHMRQNPTSDDFNPSSH
jgi:hypothetical protein